MNETLESLVASEIKPLGLELFEFRIGGSKGRPVLDVRVERVDEQEVTVDDCAAMFAAMLGRDAEGGAVAHRERELRAAALVAGLDLRQLRHGRRGVGGRHGMERGCGDGVVDGMGEPP